jgi:hypothetical protein
MGVGMTLDPPAAADQVRIARVLEQGCKHGCSGDAALVKRRIAGGSFQIWIQCSSCGAFLGSPLSQAIHTGWRDYPDDDPGIAARFRPPVNMGPTLALEASRLLQMDLFCGHEIPPCASAHNLLVFSLEDVGFRVALRRLDIGHGWTLLQHGYSALGFVSEGKPTLAKVAEMGLDILLLPSGFAALLKRHLAFMDATARAILTAVQKHQSPEETVTL